MKCEIRLMSCRRTIFRRSLKNCLIRFWTSHYTFSISFFPVSLPQARKYNLRPRKRDEELSDKTTRSLGLILIVLTKRYLLACTNSCMLFSHLSFLFAQQCSLCCLINEHDDDEEQTRYKKMEYDYLATYKKLWWQQFVQSIHDAAYF